MEIGSQIGPYRIDGLLGKGGMAEVWKAWHLNLHRHEALKVLPPQMTFDKSFVERFLHEARTAAGLQHPNITVIHTVSEADCPQPYFAMEIVEGGDLSDLIEARGRIPLEEAIPILGQIGAALDYAHSRGLIHRDVKPGNVLMKPDGSGGYIVKVVDFGIARAQEETGGTRLTKTGMIVGTPDYMSPEQGGSGATVDHHTDIYSLGVIAYEMLCGQPPFRASSDTSAIAVIMDHIRTPPPEPRSLNPEIGTNTALALMAALAKEPAARPNSCAEFVATLQGAPKARRALAPKGVSSTSSTHTPVKRRLSPALLVGALAFAGAALVGVGLTRSGQNQEGSASPIVVPDTGERSAAEPTSEKSEGDKGAGTSAATVTVPDVLNVREAQAREVTSAKSLKLDVTTQSSDQVPAGQVISQYPKAGVSVPLNSSLRVRISTGSPSGSSPSRIRSVQPPRPVVTHSWPSPDAPAYTSPLSYSDLSGKSDSELDVMRNSIFARYGRRFRRSDLQNYFDSQSWYHRNPNYSDSLLSEVERQNAALILRYQKGG